MSSQESLGRRLPRAFPRAAILVVAACLASPVLATIWIVDANNGPGTNFTTISAAVLAAQPGDRILVRAATYGENVVVNKAITIVGWNATTYPMTVPALPFGQALWGGLMVTNIPPGQTCVVSGLIIARPSSAGGTSVALLNSPGTIVLDRAVIPNGGLYVSNCSNVILEGVHVRHLPGELPPTPGVVIDNSWVQANDLDATGGDLENDPGFYPAAANAFEAWNQSVVALARPKLIGGFGGGPWVTSAATPAGGSAILCVGSVVSIADDLGSSSYVVGGQGGLRGVGSVLSIPSGSGGSAVDVRSAGIVVNKKPLPRVRRSARAERRGRTHRSVRRRFHHVLAGRVLADRGHAGSLQFDLGQRRRRLLDLLAPRRRAAAAGRRRDHA